MESRTKKASRNIFWGVISKIIAMLAPFVTRTVMIYQLGIQYTGISSLFNSLLQVLSLAELGVGSALVFSMYKPIAEDNTEKVCALLNFYKKCYRVIGCIILVLGMILMPFLDYMVEGAVPSDINLRVIYGVNLMNTVLSYFLFAYRNSIFSATQRIDINEKISLLISLLTSIFQVCALLFFKSYYVYIVVVPVMTCLNNISIYYFSKKIYPQYVPKGNISKEDVAVIKEKVAGLIFSKIGGVVLSSVDTIVISAFLGLTVLGIYNGYYYVITALFGFLGIIQSSLIPGIGNCVVKESKEKNYSNLKIFHFFYIWLTSWWCACLVSLYQPFIELWQGKENMLSIQMVVLFGIYFFVHKMGDISYIYREAIGLWWQGKFVPFIAAIVNLVINIILVNIIGLPGILISTIVSVVFVYAPGGSWVLFKYYFEDMKKWFIYMRSLVIYGVGCFIVSFVTYMVCSLVPMCGVSGLIIKALICAVFPNILLAIIYFRSENFKNAYRFVYDKYLARVLVKIRNK